MVSTTDSQQLLLQVRERLALRANETLPDKLLSDTTAELLEEAANGDTIELLDAAITGLALVAGALAPGQPRRAEALTNQGIALQRRFGLVGEAADLDLAVEVLEEAVASTRNNDPLRAARRASLAKALRTRSDYRGNHADLQRAETLDPVIRSDGNDY